MERHQDLLSDFVENDGWRPRHVNLIMKRSLLTNKPRLDLVIVCAREHLRVEPGDSGPLDDEDDYWFVSLNPVDERSPAARQLFEESFIQLNFGVLRCLRLVYSMNAPAADTPLGLGSHVAKAVATAAAALSSFEGTFDQSQELMVNSENKLQNSGSGLVRLLGSARASDVSNGLKRAASGAVAGRLIPLWRIEGHRPPTTAHERMERAGELKRCRVALRAAHRPGSE